MKVSITTGGATAKLQLTAESLDDCVQLVKANKGLFAERNPNYFSLHADERSVFATLPIGPEIVKSHPSPQEIMEIDATP